MLTVPLTLRNAIASLIGYPPILQPLLTRRLADGVMLGAR